MKVAYMGKMQLSDVDLSYLHTAQQKADITFFLEVTPRFQNGPAFSLPTIYKRTGVFKAVKAYPELARYAQFIDIDKFFVVNSYGRLWVLRALWANILLLFFLLRKKFDIIHLTWPLNIYEFTLYALSNKMAMTVHDPFPHTGLNTPIVRLRRAVAFKLVRHFFILNKSQRDAFIATHHLADTQVTTSHLSSYTCLNAIKPNRSVVPQERYILFAGKISRYKGLDYLLPAMVEVHKRFPTVSLVVAGGGSYHFDTTAYKCLDYIDLRNRFIPDEEMVALVQSAEFLVCPYTDATQSGVIMTAFAFAKPTIATNVGGLPEMVRNGEFGLIVQEKSKDSLVEAIEGLLSDPCQLSKMSDNIQHAYEKGELSWDATFHDFMNGYRRLCH